MKASDLFFTELILIILFFRGCGGVRVDQDSIKQITEKCQVKNEKINR